MNLFCRDTLLKVKEEDLEEIRSKYVELLAVSDYTSHHAQQQQQHQQNANHNHLNHNHHNQHVNVMRQQQQNLSCISQLQLQQQQQEQQQQQQQQQYCHQQQQQPQQTRLKTLMGVADGGQSPPGSGGRENLTFSPLIES